MSLLVCHPGASERAQGRLSVCAGEAICDPGLSGGPALCDRGFSEDASECGALASKDPRAAGLQLSERGGGPGTVRALGTGVPTYDGTMLEQTMREKMWWTVWALSAAMMVGACDGDDVRQVDRSDASDGSGEDVDADVREGGEDVSGEDDGGSADVDDHDSGEVIAPQGCPPGQRVVEEGGACEVVPTLRIYAQDLQVHVDGELSSESRGILVCAGSSESYAGLARVTLAQTERCRVYGERLTVEPEITGYDAGPVTISGLNEVNPAVYAPSESSSCYTPPEGLSPQSMFDREAELRVVAVGSDANPEAVFPAFERTMQTLAPGEVEHDAIVPGQPIEVRWSANPQASRVRIDVDGRGADGTDVLIVCEVGDSGRYTIDAELTAYLPAERSSELVSLDQYHTERIEPDDSEVLIMLTTGASVWKR